VAKQHQLTLLPQVPCSQCVARNYVCQPRFSSRRPRPIRKPTGRSESLSVPAEAGGLGNNHVINMEQSSDFMSPAQDSSGNETFDFADIALSQVPLDMTGYEDFAGLSYPVTLTHDETMDESTSHMMFSSMPWMGSSGLVSQNSSTRMGSTEAHQQHLELPFPGPNQLPTPHTTQSPQTTTLDMSNVAASDRSLEGVRPAEADKVEDVLRALAELLAQPGAWREFPSNSCEATQTLDHDARDRIVAAVQLLLHRALCQNRVVLSPSTHGAFGRIVALPPSHVLVYFLELYATRIDSIHPYLGLSGSPRINIDDILQIDMADVGILLVILLIAQGAMLSNHHESLILAHGLVEICKLALNDLLETRSIAQPMVGGCALQLLTLCAWSGKHPLAKVSKVQRGYRLLLD
jgi:hypothetical protein